MDVTSSTTIEPDVQGLIDRTVTRKKLILGSLFVAFVLTLFAAINIGPANISIATTARILLSRIPFLGGLISETWTPVQEAVVIAIRLPRVLTGAIVGAALAVAGCAMQGLFRNPMASPYILGVSSGAAFGAALAIVLGVSIGGFGIPAAAFIFATVAVFTAYYVALDRGKVSVATLLLAGIAMAALFSAMVSFINYVAGEKLSAVVFWIMGGLWASDWSKFLIALPLILPGVLGIFLFSKDLNLMLLGEETAVNLGVNIEGVKKIILALSALVTAAAVCISGVIGFVGLIIPHIVRIFVGSDHKVLIPASCLVGAIFLILADTIARTLIHPTELPVGLVTALFGAPFFLFLLRRKKSVMGW